METRLVRIGEAAEQVGELSRMKRELNGETLASLEGNRGKYAERLQAVADATFRNGRHVGGTTIGGPSALVRNKRGRIRQEVLRGTAMYVREMPTPEGVISMFPLHTEGMTQDGRPIIDPSIEGSYTVLHRPEGRLRVAHSPHEMIADLIFTVDADNLVTIAGQTVATAQERELFDAIVVEFERLAALRSE